MLPQPALPKVPGRSRQAMARRTRGRAVAGAVLHVVFTLPAPIADIAYQNKAVIYDLLFKASAETTLTIAADPKHLGARIGITAVLHTWGSAHHPPSACAHDRAGRRLVARWQTVAVVPARFFLPVRVLSRLFRRLFLEKLVAAHAAGQLQFFGQHAHLAERAAFAAFLAPLRKIEWYVYAKQPFGGPEAVLAYLSRYTHRVAIANSRLIAFNKNGVTFKYKDYRVEGPDRYKTMTLATDEFIRRFLIHVLPKGFHRIRHYGLFAKATAPPTSHAPANCSVAKCPKAKLQIPMIMMATRRPRSRTLVHAAADA